VSTINAAGLCWTFFRREAISIGGGGLLKGFEGARGEVEDLSDSVTSLNAIAKLEEILFSLAGAAAKVRCSDSMLVVEGSEY
jgi:hypothetical protein